MFEHFTWVNIMARPEIIVPPLIFYGIYFWGLPLLGCINTKDTPPLVPYWKAVWQVSGLFHIAGVAAIILTWLAWPYMVIS
jgi:hypothetical protein